MTATTLAAPIENQEEQPATLPAWIEDEQPATVESGLPATHQEAYRMKMAGRSQQEIADHFGVDRVTIWRWCKAVESEYREMLEAPPMNILASEVGKLTNLEESARRNAEQTKSDRAKAAYLAEARRCCTARTALLTTVGVLPKEPSRLLVASVRKDLDKTAGDVELTRDEAIERMVQIVQRTRLIK